MAMSSSYLIFLIAYSVLFLHHDTEAKPHGFNGHRKFRRDLSERRNPQFEVVATENVRTFFTTTVPCTTSPNAAPTGSSAHSSQCKRTKVAVLGAGVAGITAAVCQPLVEK